MIWKKGKNSLMTFKHWNKNQKCRKDRGREERNIQKTTWKSILEADNLTSSVCEDHRRQVVKHLKIGQYYFPCSIKLYKNSPLINWSTEFCSIFQNFGEEDCILLWSVILTAWRSTRDNLRDNEENEKCQGQM